MTYLELIIQIANADNPGGELPEELQAEISHHLRVKPGQSVLISECERLLTDITQYHISQAKKNMQRADFQDYFLSIEDIILGCDQQSFVLMPSDRGLLVLKAVDASVNSISFEMLKGCVRQAQGMRRTPPIAHSPHHTAPSGSAREMEATKKQAPEVSVKKLNKLLDGISTFSQKTQAIVKGHQTFSEAVADEEGG